MKCEHCNGDIEKTELVKKALVITGKTHDGNTVMPHYIFVCPNCDKILSINPVYSTKRNLS